MRAELSTIQQTLTPEAATVLNHSIAEAGRRNHGQTTPIHVAATLLASPSGYLRQACIKSHPNSSHPLQCRALELCFSVALERLPTAQNMSPGLDPPISNALMAALKRAQAHQRRGCPEQQQQPLLAVKVELEQLIISILDDPSVSRVMREASFSSPAVKATIEQSLNSPPSAVASSPIGLGFRPTPAATTSRNLYLNPRLQQGGAAAQSGRQRGEEVKRVMDIFLRTKKRNPVLVGDSEPEAVMEAVLRRIENKEVGEGLLKNVEVIHLDKEFINDRDQIPLKIKELGAVVDARIGNLSGGGIILDLGDLKWLVHEPAVPGSGTMQQKVATEAGRPAVSEMGKLLARFREREEASGGSGRVWLAGTATCETYLRCQVYYSSLEVDWDLQAVPIAARAPMSGLFPRLGGNGILSSSVDALSPLKGSTIAAAGAVQPRRLSENLDPTQRTSCCPQCMRSYEQELAKLGPKDSEKFSSEIKPEAARPALPQWLQNAKPHDGGAKTTDQLQNNDQEIIWKQKAEELKKKWTDICIRQHNFGSDRIAPATLSVTGLYNSNLLGRQPFQPKFQLNRSLGDTMKLNPSLVPSQPAVRTATPPGSPVRTELALGNSKVPEITPEKARKELTKDFLGCISSEPENRIHELQSDKLASAFDTNSFKKLLKGLLEKVYWQREAASAVATTVTKCKMGNGKRRSGGPKGDTWLLFMGPDRVGKKKMAAALADLVCGTTPITISLGSRRNDGESDVNFRGKTVLDRIGDAIRRNPFSVIVLEDIDEVDMLLRGSIKRAMERGRLADSNGREISLANVMFILTASILPENLRFLSNGISLDEEKLASLARGNWQLRLSLCEKSMKRRANWLHDGDNRTTKTKKLDAGSGLSFDLNEAAADAEDERAAGPSNSSDLTVDHEDDHVLDNRQSLTTTTASAAAAARELLNYVDDAIVFKPVDFGPIRRDIANSITKKFSAIISEGHTIEVPDEALEKILSGVWLGRTGLEEWTEKVLVPSFHQLKAHLSSNVSSTSNESMVVRLEPDGDANSRRYGDWLPSNVKVVSNSNGL